MWTSKSLLAIFSLTFVFLLYQAEAVREYCDLQKEAFFFTKTYKSPFIIESVTSWKCSVSFTTTHTSATIKLKGLRTDSSAANWCKEKIIAYDGSSDLAPELQRVCAIESLDVESSGSIIYLVYKSESPNIKWMQLSYVAVDNLGSGNEDNEYESRLKGQDTMIAILVPSLLVLTFTVSAIVYCVFRKKKLDTELNDNGYSALDLSLARSTLLAMARNGSLTTNYTDSRGQPVSNSTRKVKPKEVKRAIKKWCNRGCVADSNDPVQMMVEEQMLWFTGRTQSSNSNVIGTRRVRHPAGDRQPNQASTSDQYPLNIRQSASDVEFLSVSGPGEHQTPSHHGDFPSPYTDFGGSNNNLAINNNLTPNLNYPNGQQHSGGGSSHHHMSSQSNPSPYSSLGRQSSPRGSPRLHDPSPHHHHHHHRDRDREREQGSMSNMLTYYGVIDGDGAASASSAPSSSLERRGRGDDFEEPPPSYDEVTAGGKLAPHETRV